MEYPPEAVIKTTKALLLRAAGNSDELRPFAEAAVAWAIEAYYDGRSEPGVSLRCARRRFQLRWE